MIEILNNHCNDKNGLLLFNPPTGSGKTHTVLKWIYDNYEDYCKEGKKIFFITNLKKNLPYEELRENFFLPKKGGEEKFDKYVTFLDSNSEELIKNFQDTKGSISEYFKKTTAFYDLKGNLSEINKHKDNPNLKSYVDKLKDDLREDLEPKFRRSIEKHLKENFRNKEERIKAIKYDDDYKWIGKLYPAVFTSRKKIFFLSIDKFYFKNSTLVEPSYSFLENDITKNSIIFIDEFDATKQSLLDRIIKKGLQKKIDFIHLFNLISRALSTNILPENLITHSEERNKIIKNNKNNEFLVLKDVQKRLNEKAQEIVKEYTTDYSFKTVGNTDDHKNQRNLLFHDFQYHTVYKDDKNFIHLNINNDDKVNQITFKNGKPKKDEKNIVSLLNQIRGFFKLFSLNIKNLAENNYQLENEKREKTDSIESEFTFDLALSTILEEFGLEQKYYKDYIIENILSARKISRNKPNELDYDLSFYKNGFRYYSFVDSEFHNSKTKIFIYDYQETPENFILKLAKRSKVIGISATALIETVTGNYDFKYFESQLGNNFIKLSKKEKKILSDLFNKQNKHYDKVKIHTEWISFISDEDREHILSEFEKLFEDKELAEEIYGLTPKNDTNSYLFNRYLKIGHCFKEFLLKDDIKGFLCLLNKEPTRRSKDLNLDVLEKIFEHLIKEYLIKKDDDDDDDEFEVKVKVKVEDFYVIVNGSDYEKKKKIFIDRLEKGQKTFIISMYQTMGAGQNIQYISPNPEELIDECEESENWNKERKTDINAIYLDKPTHLIQNINKDLKEEEFVKFIFQLEFLAEAGAISPQDLKNYITLAFKNLKSKQPYLFNKSPQNKDINGHFAKHIIQAIGRICRTNLKSPNIYIYADSELDEKIANFNLDDDNNIFLKEFEALVKSSQKRDKKKRDDEINDKYKNLAKRKDKQLNTYIKRFINQDWNWKPKQVEEWNKLRTMYLRFPTISQEYTKESNQNGILNLYIEQPSKNNQYSYSQKEDYKEVKVSFNNDLPQKVSEESARLGELLEISDVRNLFRENKWAESFTKNKFILSPTFFNNIYKGALGEQIGKFIFEKHFKIELEELPIKHYELFDYKIKDTNTYVDFKHWKESTKISYDEQVTKILRKAKTVSADKIFIINILSSTESNILKSKNTGIEIIEVPYLWNSEEKKFNDKLLKEITNNKKII